MSKLSMFVVLAGCLLVLLGSPAVQGAGTLKYKRNVLCRVEFGDEYYNVKVWWGFRPGDPRIGKDMGGDPAALEGFMVDRRRFIYLGDSGQVKKFVSPGVCRGVTQKMISPREDDVVEWPYLAFYNGRMHLTSFTVDDKRHLHVIHSAGRLWSKFDATGRHLWSKRISDIFPYSDTEQVFNSYGLKLSSDDIHISRIFSGPDKKLYCEIHVKGSSGRWSVRSALGVCNTEGESLKILTPRQWHLESQAQRRIALGRGAELDLDSGKVTSYAKGGFTREVVLEMDSPSLKDVKFERQYYPQQMWAVFVDSKGRIYLKGKAPRKKPHIYTYWTSVDTDDVIAVFDSNGRLMKQFRFPKSPFSKEAYANELAVDADGTIYHMAYDEMGVSIVEYRPASPKPVVWPKPW